MAETAGTEAVAGVDEAGRGPLAGPVLAAVVILEPADIPDGLDDSKRVGRTLREALHDEIMARAIVGVGQASVEEIDEINILKASHLAMMRALAALPAPPDHVLVDGPHLPVGLTLPATGLVRGDALSLSIAAASIVAKVTRDRIMVDLSQQCPGYGWETNMGYGSKSHIAALQDLGASPHHRRSFAPVHQILYQAKT